MTAKVEVSVEASVEASAEALVVLGDSVEVPVFKVALVLVQVAFKVVLAALEASKAVLVVLVLVDPEAPGVVLA